MEESLYWRILGDGSVVMSDDGQIIKQKIEIGLKSFEHPENNMKAMPMIDSEGVICGSNFQVDACTKINAIPRRGTEANWALANTR
ncbi:BnaC03g47750D [Brassica napus]|uniref:BnaC03g47750D protein n=1 Tax=Brassica napus TaxID=3708 RepID=A0A078F434_BRANA|nr:BnaC03g47750D [Brassica napus]